MHTIDTIYIDGQFVIPHGTEMAPLFDPSTGRAFGQVRLADGEDARLAVAAAERALPAMAATSVAERIAMLRRLHEAVLAVADPLFDAVIQEYGAPVSRARWMVDYAAASFANAIETLEQFSFSRQMGTAHVVYEPIGVAGLITPWNSNAGFICNKLAYALAAGCTAVIKPSEMSALQTRIVSEALHAAGLPPGVFNIVTGRGDTVGAAIVDHPAVRKISFTGSTAVGKSIARAGVDSLKRVTLELGGKSPFIVLDDADFNVAAPMALQAGFLNSGQACLAGTRILVPRPRLAEFEAALLVAMEGVKAGDPRDPATTIGPMVSQKQWDRVQRYIGLGIEQGARLIAGGPGRPSGFEAGWLVRPTIFSDVDNSMQIARDEIFGPVLCVIAYDDVEQAIAIANDTVYGLQAYVGSADPARGRAVAARLEAGRVHVNTLAHEPKAPFGGFKQSGIGREFGEFGLLAYLEPKAVISA